MDNGSKVKAMEPIMMQDYYTFATLFNYAAVFINTQIEDESTLTCRNSMLIITDKNMLASP